MRTNANARRQKQHMRLCSLAVLPLVLICGCESYPEDGGMANSYYLHPHKDLHRLGRVALVELDNISDYPQVSADVTEALFLAVQKKQLFGLARIPRDDPAWRSFQENIDSFQAWRGLMAMRDTRRTNGLLVGTITEYRPYPRLVLGLRLKLLDLRDGQTLWGLEQVWDASDKSIQKRVQAYFKKQMHSGLTPLREGLIVVSPLEFFKFTAYEVAETLERGKD
jgi:hypothetical protein